MSRWRETWSAIAGSVLVAACVRLDGSHCANLQGDATCAERDVARAYCSECTAQHDGCVAAPVEVDCVPSLGSSSSSSAGDGVTIADGGDDPSVASDASADDGASSAPTTADVTATNAGTNASDDDDSVGEGDAGTTSDDPGTTSNASDDAPDDGGPEDDDTTTPTTMTDAPGESSGGPVCGDGIQEGDEECDAFDLNGATCLEDPRYADGTITCDQYCMLNTSDCETCVALAGVCATDDACCVGHCNLNLCVL